MVIHTGKQRHRFTLAVLLFLALVGTVSAVSAMPVPEGQENVTRGELSTFDQFLDGHPKMAQDLQKNPALVNNPDFLEDHPELREFLNTHPEVREELKENPRAFMKRERRFEQSAGDITGGELRTFDQFLDSHSKIARDLQRNPGLVNNPDYLEDHPALREFLNTHPEVRKELKENPRAFMRRERRFEKHERREGRLEKHGARRRHRDRG